MAGGLFQLIAFGAQDHYLMGNDQFQFKNEPIVYQPKMLNALCFDKLTEKDKTWLVANKDSFPLLADKVMKRTNSIRVYLIKDLKTVCQPSDKYIVVTKLLRDNVGWNKFHTKTQHYAEIRYRKQQKQQKQQKRYDTIASQITQRPAIKEIRRLKKCTIETDDINDYQYLNLLF